MKDETLGIKVLLEVAKFENDLETNWNTQISENCLGKFLMARLRK